VCRQRVLHAAYPAGQLGQLVPRRQQRPPRGRARLAFQQGGKLAVEVGRRLQQAVPQPLELVLLEQEVLADAGVERLDRLDGQLVPLLDPPVRRGLAAERRHELVVLAPQRAVRGGLHGDRRGRPAHDGQDHGRRQRRDRRPPAAPQPRPLGRPHPPRRHRPALQPGA
jgi:hypothetical protein